MAPRAQLLALAAGLFAAAAALGHLAWFDAALVGAAVFAGLSAIAEAIEARRR